MVVNCYGSFVLRKSIEWQEDERICHVEANDIKRITGFHTLIDRFVLENINVLKYFNNDDSYIRVEIILLLNVMFYLTTLATAEVISASPDLPEFCPAGVLLHASKSTDMSLSHIIIFTHSLHYTYIHPSTGHISPQMHIMHSMAHRIGVQLENGSQSCPLSAVCGTRIAKFLYSSLKEDLRLILQPFLDFFYHQVIRYDYFYLLNSSSAVQTDDNHTGTKYAITKIQDNREGLELNGLHQLLVYADNVTMLEENPQIIRENTEILLEASKEICLEVTPEKTKFMIMSRDQNIVRNGNIKTGNYSLERRKNSNILEQQ
ncbi:hypothetical protein ANN_04408 [Periplaneta americana]|uniref:Reverse transcriptase domain-containing protein n=1 Tax=Periplaneta americana TaxID=6978 RepID=A0ABQ8TAV6_PERAM|nr:hypothetical protein ANN_04408 [Periplaneta americana]